MFTGGKSKSPMTGKKFISKSSENLSSQRKGRQLTTVPEAPKPRGNAASVARAAAAAEKNKENMTLKEKDKNSGVFAKVGNLLIGIMDIVNFIPFFIFKNVSKFFFKTIKK